MKPRIFLPVLFLFLILAANISAANPCLCGYTGLILAPGAEITGDAMLTAGMGYITPKYAVIRGPVLGEKVYFINLGYLPFFEICIRAVQRDHIGNTGGIGDRSSCMRFKVLSEKRYTPEVLFGFHDIIGGARNYQACYGVISKEFYIENNISFNITFGHGNDFIKNDRRNCNIRGFFGGVSFRYREIGEFVTDYDTKKFNCGVKCCLFKRINVIVALLDLKSLTGGLSYSYQL